MGDVEVLVEGGAGLEGVGRLAPRVGSRITIVPAQASPLDLSVDYSARDRVVVKVGGTFTVRHDGLKVEGGLGPDVFDGETALRGTITYRIDENVSATVSASVGATGPQLGAALTIRF